MSTRFTSDEPSRSTATNPSTNGPGTVGTETERIVILGASNVAISFSRLVHSLKTVVPDDRQLDLLVACGHGRSYGKYSRVLVRTLPGIIECGLWKKLDELEASRTENSPTKPRAIITDVGNDLIYGVSPEQLVTWVEECVRRLQKYESEIVLTGIPLPSLLRLSPLRYTLTQKFFFLDKKSTRDGMMQKAEELNLRLAEMVERYSVTIQPQPIEWFGFDPIHFRHRERASVWRTLCSHWSGFDADRSDWKNPPFGQITSLAWKPAEQWWFGKSRGAPQPYYHRDRLRVFLY